MTFLEKFGLLYSPISCLHESHSKLYQNRYCSWVIALVNVYCLCLVGKVFHQYFLCFLEMFLGYMIFPRFYCDKLDMGYLVFFLFLCRNFFVFNKNVWVLCSMKWSFQFASEVYFGVDLKTCQFIFYSIDIVITLSVLSDFIRVYFIIKDCFNKLFLMKFYHSCVYFCNF